ncbi:hypothetical protein QQS21_002785 [Conoideocrella luteorostrata]|uniref:DNA (cytosine-5-)-methyltransferase n=1 Tax=Conoideocrella luteorostrata TaxID=1105319 RepID=A0AAJ0G127_9HYPO|nr:hypothetical protein QQS21_002785 [Conoideocrella luteorostrata]
MACLTPQTGSSIGRNRSGSIASSCTLGYDSNDEVTEVGDDQQIIDLTCGGVSPQYSSYLCGSGISDSTRSHTDQICISDLCEVKDTLLGTYPVDFIRVRDISQRTAKGRIFRGLPFLRTRNMKGRLPKKSNELCMVLQFPSQPSGVSNDNALLIDVKEEMILRKRKLITTNAIYPEHTSKQGSRRSAQERAPSRLHQIQGYPALVCRWKWTRKTDEEAIERILPSEVLQIQYLVLEEALCNRWRGGRHRGGSWGSGHSSIAHHVDINRVSDESSNLTRQFDQKYTLFDAFSGAGGVSRGAQNAGFKVTHAVDNDPAVWDTYSSNFPETHLYEMSIDTFVQQNKQSSIRVDVLHISPPCQYFSPAHTRPSAQDEDNTDAILCCHELVHTLRPRLVTLEETFGLAFDRHKEYLHSIIGDLTHQGYSVRWKVVELSAWGSAQSRKRLIILAAGPGETLPTFPPSTHSKNGGCSLLPYTTIRKALSRLRPGDDLHDLATEPRYSPPRLPLSFDTQIGTVCAGHGDFYYPDGTRNYTLREYASLQGFPIFHKFRGIKKNIKRQIGNAFPPNTVKVLYKHLEKWLLRQDRVATYQPRPNQVAVLDRLPDTGDISWGSPNNTMDWESDVLEVS